MQKQPFSLILASSSPYRRQMLQRFGLQFTVISPDVDETPHEHETPTKLALRLAEKKALHVAQQFPQALVIGADQVATIDGDPIGKPGDFANAFKQLKRLSGQSVQFHSALCVCQNGHIIQDDVVTYCKFRTLSDEEINHYLNFEQPFDTAGSAKAEGLGISLLESMRSDDPTAIIGLPLISLANMLRSFGLNPTLFAQSRI